MADITGTTGDDTLNGTAAADLIIGLEGNDILNGLAGADRMEGGIGNDTFFVDSANEVIIENAGEGVDVLYSLVSYAIATDQEVEVLSAFQSSTQAVNLTGNGVSQTLIGNAGNNVLTGGGGADVFYGLAGNDTYVVDSADDFVYERVGDSVHAGLVTGDWIMTSISYQLLPGSEIEFLSTTNQSQSSPINLTGNEFGQDITGNQGDNVLIGGGGIDGLFGRGGNDTYFVDNYDDAVIEDNSDGVDVVYASVTYALRFANRSVEILSAFQSSTDRVDLTGNELSQSIIGNQGVNVLRSGGGSDTLYGLGGDDTYVVSGDCLVVERFGDGYDSVYADGDFTINPVCEIEFLTTTGVSSFTPIHLTGNDYAQTLWGSQGQVSNDVLDGRGGSDTLWGFMGNDLFTFSTGLGASNVDHIIDFSNVAQNDDTVALEDVIFSGTGAPGAFNAACFVAGTAALDADDRIIYDQATGNLYFDIDGSGAGAQVLFAVLDNKAPLTASDFTVI
jgi:Ca2+-binding RTX toxin-like protein